MSFLPGLLIIAAFALFAGLMMSRRMPALLALPCMSVVIALISGAFYSWPEAEPVLSSSPFGRVVRFFFGGAWDSVLTEHQAYINFVAVDVLTAGPARLATAAMFAIFGAILSQQVMRSGIAQRIVSVTAEYAGDRKMLLAGLLTVVVAVCFTTVTGLGAVIMLGSLVLPILLGAGLSAEFSACLMLFAIAIGGVFNPVNYGFYITTIGVSEEVAKKYMLVYGLLLSLAAFIFFLVKGRAESRSYAWAAPAPQAGVSGRSVPLPALVTPLVPIGLIMLFNWQIIPAFVAGIIYGTLTTDPKNALQNITAATLEGLKDVAPVIGLFIGIGMALNAMMADPTKQVLEPLMRAIIPSTPLGYLFFFTLLAPLALYRGPLNFFGLGAGVAGLIKSVGLMPPVALMASFFAVGQIQGVCDPTNTSNVWLATFTKSSTERFLKITIPYVWGFVLVALAYASLIDGVMSQ